MAKFITELVGICLEDNAWELKEPLIYQSDIVGQFEVPPGFQTDFASVPRLPFIYTMFGDRAHRESVLHDYLYRIDSVPLASYRQANNVFFEAMRVRNKSLIVSWGMWAGVVIGGWTHYHKKYVGDSLSSIDGIT